MSSLPVAVRSVAQVRAIDRYAIETLSIPGYTLMSRAGEAAVSTLLRAWPATTAILVACGSGNNAGDGYVVARLARARGLSVRVLALGDPATLAGDALTAWRDYIAAGGTTESWRDDSLKPADVIVDALFGTGLKRPLDAGWSRWIDALNTAGRPILALDVPSGLDADTGEIRGRAIHADCTITFVGLKLGLYVGSGPDCTGTVSFDDLAIPAVAADGAGQVATRISRALLAEVLPPRRRTAHKGDYGHVLLIAGGPGMAGAARLAGEACLRSGAGRVTVATRPENVAAIIAGRPELMVRAVDNGQDLGSLLEQIDLIAIGPGLGLDDWGQALLESSMSAAKPMVVDADALTLLALKPRRRENWILTPHPGEAGRLLGCSAAEIQHDRLGAARQLTARYGGVAILKGAGTIVFRDGELPALCDHGNPGMAAPGMGDVLTGIVAGMAVQTPDLCTAARAGVLIHALAGDAAARTGERGLLASDLFPQVSAIVNPVQ